MIDILILVVLFVIAAKILGSAIHAGGQSLGNLLYNLSRLPRNIRLGYTGEFDKLTPWERRYGKTRPSPPPPPRPAPKPGEWQTLGELKTWAEESWARSSPPPKA